MNDRHGLRLEDGDPISLLEFPCEIGLKRILVDNIEDFLKHFNFINKFENDGVYNSIYSFPGVKLRRMKRDLYVKANVNKIVIDIDLSDYNYDINSCYSDLITIHEFLMKYDIQHIINFSGNGYHVYIGVNSDGISEEEKNIYINALFDIIKDITHIKICESCYNSPVSRIIRTVGSYYTKPEKKKKEDEINEKKDIYLNWIMKNRLYDRYCVNLDDDIIYDGVNKIYEHSKKQSFSVVLFGSKLINMGVIDIKSKLMMKNFIQTHNSNLNLVVKDDTKDPYVFLEKCGIFRDEIPICIKVLMTNENMRYRERFVFVIYLAKSGLNKEEIRNIMKMILSSWKFRHAYEEEIQSGQPLPDYIYDCFIDPNIDYDVNCGSLRNIGYCSDLCQEKDLFYYQ